MICLSAIIGQRVIRLLLYFGLYLAGEQLGKLSTIILLRKNVLETLCVLGHMAKYKNDDFEPSKQRASSACQLYNVRLR